jgi:hypothetical protein
MPICGFQTPLQKHQTRIPKQKHPPTLKHEGLPCSSNPDHEPTHPLQSFVHKNAIPFFFHVLRVAPRFTPAPQLPSTFRYVSSLRLPGRDHSPLPHKTCSLSRLGRISRPVLRMNVTSACVTGDVKSQKAETMCEKRNASVRSRCRLLSRTCERKTRSCVPCWSWRLFAHVAW